MSQDYVVAQFDWDDTTVYRWRIDGQQSDMSELIGFLIGGAVIFPLMVFAIPWAAGFVWRPLSFWLGLFVFLFLCLIFAQQLWLAWRGSRLARISARSILYWVSVVMAWGLVYLAAVRGSPFRGGFEGEIHRTGHWLLYFLDNVLRVVLLDVFEIFEIQFSGISPGTWYARTITVFLRIMITAGLLDLALSTRKYYFDVLEFTGTVRECYVWCDSLPEFDPGVMLVQVSRLESLAEPHAVEAGDFLAAFKDRAG